MIVDPKGLPPALLAWRDREAEPMLTIRCGAAPDCGQEVGAVYRGPRTLVVESRTSVPQQQAPKPFAPAEAAETVDVAALLHGFEWNTDAGARDGEETVEAQIDLLDSSVYWQNPSPVCPVHGDLRVEQRALRAAVRDGRDSYEAPPA